MRPRNAKNLFVIIFVLLFLYACQSEPNTTIETTSVPTTETLTYDLPHDLYFDFEIDYSSDQDDLSQSLSELKNLIEPYAQEKLYERVGEYIDSNVTGKERIYIEDLEYFEVFDTYVSKDTMFFNDLMYVVSILEYPNIELGVINTLNVDYYKFDYNCAITGCDLSENGDVEVLVLLGNHQIYADIWLYDEEDELEKRSTYRIVYDEEGIVELDKYEFNALLDDYLIKNEFTLIDYTRGEGGMMMTSRDNILGIRSFEMLIFDEHDNFSSYSYDSSPEQLVLVRVNVEEEYFFWTVYDEDQDFRNLSLYENNVFQVSYRYLYDAYYDSLFTSRIEYNLKDINNVSYYEDRNLYYYDTQDELQSIPYMSIEYSQYFEPGFSPTIEYDLDEEISQSLYENPLEVLEYGHVPYEDLISVWNSFDNVWEEFYLEDSTLNIRLMDIDLDQFSLELLPDFTYHSFIVFIDDIHERNPESVYID